MAQYQHLNIYKTAYSLLITLMPIARRYPRDYKYTLGEKLQNAVVEIILNIYKANSAKNKLPYLQKISEKIQEVNLFLRVSFDLKIISQITYAKLVELSTSVAKQCQGWYNKEDDK